MARNEIRLMEAAIALAEELNFSRAGYRLGVTQPAVTKQVAELEDRLGFPLFERDHQLVTLTDAGRAFVEEARLAVLHSERAIQAARAALNKAEVILRVGKSPYTDPFLTSTLLAVRLPLFPNLKIELSSGFSCDLIHEVLAGKLDLALATEPPRSPVLSMTKVSESPFYLAVSEESGFAEQPALQIEDLDGATWVLFGRRLHASLYDTILRLAEARDIRPREIHHIMFPEEAYHFVADNNAIAFLTKAGAIKIAGDGVTIRPLNEAQLTLRTYLASRSDNNSKLVSEIVRGFGKKMSAIEREAQMRLPLAG